MGNAHLIFNPGKPLYYSELSFLQLKKFENQHFKPYICSISILLFRYYFDFGDGTCKMFYYGGCEGNKNSYKTLESCQGRCSLDFSIPIEEEFKMEFCFLAMNEGTK